MPRPLSSLFAATALTALVLAAPLAAQSLKGGEVLSSVAVAPISAPHPVRGADGRTHLAYELLVSNASDLFVTLEKVEAVDPAGAVLWAREGEALAKLTRLYGGTGLRLPPGGTAIVFTDVSFAAGTALPERVAARITATRQGAKDGKPAPLPPDFPVGPHFTFTGAETGLGRPAVVVEPPLRGAGWVAANGCCDAITSHRGAIMAVNGRLRVPERFAIDFVKLNDAGRFFTGDGSKLASFAFYGLPVHAVADGVVVNVYDEAPEQVPGQDATGITPANVGGNMLVMDIGGGNFAFYAHLQKGSLRYKLGETVRTGAVIGLLGNTGNSSAPHLHFHVMDGPSPLDANGLPYAFTRFTGQGLMPDDQLDALESGAAVTIDTTRLAGPRQDALPLNNEVVSFD